MNATNGHATLTNTADQLDPHAIAVAGGVESLPIAEAASAYAEGGGLYLGEGVMPGQLGRAHTATREGSWTPPPPPPLEPLAELVAPVAAGPSGPLADLPYRWTARLMILDRPDMGHKPHLFRLEGPIPHDALPVPLTVAEPGTNRTVQVGTITKIYPTAGGDGAREVCAAGLFDLDTPYVPALVRELVTAAAHGSPMGIVPMLVARVHAEPVDGVEVVTAWRIASAKISPAATWPGCIIVPDDAHVFVEIGGEPYPMRRHHNARVWKTLTRAWQACHHMPGVGAWDKLNAALAILQAACDTVTLEAIARRLSAPTAETHALTPLALMACIDRLVADLNADDEARGGGR